jgi:hypothetical protein
VQKANFSLDSYSVYRAGRDISIRRGVAPVPPDALGGKLLRAWNSLTRRRFEAIEGGVLLSGDLMRGAGVLYWIPDSGPVVGLGEGDVRGFALSGDTVAILQSVKLEAKCTWFTRGSVGGEWMDSGEVSLPSKPFAVDFIEGERAIAVTSGGLFYCDRDCGNGHLLWQRDLAYFCPTSVAVDENGVAFIGARSGVIAVDLECPDGARWLHYRPVK